MMNLHVSCLTYTGLLVDTLVSQTIQTESEGSGSDNQWTCVHVWASRIGTGRVQADESYETGRERGFVVYYKSKARAKESI